MKFKIRTKVLFGILFLFVEFVLIGALSIYYISTIKYSSEMTIKNNYRSVHYSENMIQAIDETNTAVNSMFFNKQYRNDKNSLSVPFSKFEENLNQEEANITEFGEKDLVQSIKQTYIKYKSLVSEQKTDNISDKVNYYTVNIMPLANELKTKIFTVSTLNMQSILQKNESLNEKIRHIYKILSIVMTVCFLITFSFMINFPNYIAGPIKKIIENIKEITDSNFRSRIKISTGDEFKELAEAINFMAEKLEQNYQHPAVEKQPVIDKKNIDNNLVIENIQSLLGSVSTLLDAISQSNDDETLQKQSMNLKEIEIELSKAIKS
jgi:nitrogen fixation/metabolism regulation signal transduction histidine kinase